VDSDRYCQRQVRAILNKKLECLLGLSLERMAEILAWPVAKLDPPALALWGRVFQVFMMIVGRKLWREPARGR
jgi:hypothetical protein